jgi:hypothetical protein
MKKKLLVIMVLTLTLFFSEAVSSKAASINLSGLIPTHEPATVALLGIGLVGLAWVEVRRRRKKIEVGNIRRSLVTKIERLNRHLQSS